jgi:hypothetical protein
VRGTRWFVASAGAILATTALAKVWSAFGTAKSLAVADPIIGVQFRNLLLAVGVAELIIASVCLLSTNTKVTTMLIAWITTNFLAYRLGLSWMDWHRPCGCLGNLTETLHISPQAADTVMRIVLGYLLVGSYGSLFWTWRQERNARAKCEFVRSETQLQSEK